MSDLFKKTKDRLAKKKEEEQRISSLNLQMESERRQPSLDKLQSYRSLFNRYNPWVSVLIVDFLQAIGESFPLVTEGFLCSVSDWEAEFLPKPVLWSGITYQNVAEWNFGPVKDVITKTRLVLSHCKYGLRFHVFSKAVYCQVGYGDYGDWDYVYHLHLVTLDDTAHSLAETLDRLV